MAITINDNILLFYYFFDPKKFVEPKFWTPALRMIIIIITPIEVGLLDDKLIVVQCSRV